MEKICYTETSTRVCLPDETLENVQRLLVEGNIVPKLFRIDSLDCIGIPVYMSYSKNPKTNEIDYAFPHAGKGFSVKEAKCSAIFEAIERYSAKMSGKESLILSSHVNLQNSIPPDKFILENDSPIDNESLLEWVEGYSIVNQSKVYVPAQFVYFPYRPIDKKITYISPNDTNGIASGNTISEAILHGICEVVEKDAFSIFMRKPELFYDLELDQIKNDKVKQILDKLDALNVKYYIKDMTTNIKIPSVSVYLDCRALGGSSFVFGGGAHLDIEIALLRALTEAIQMRGSQLILEKYQPELNKEKIEKVGSNTLDILKAFMSNDCHEYFNKLVNSNKYFRKLSSYFLDLPDNIDDQISQCVKEINNKGYDVIYYDLTREETNIPSVRILIPGLQPSIGLDTRLCPRLIEAQSWKQNHFECQSSKDRKYEDEI